MAQKKEKRWVPAVTNLSAQAKRIAMSEREEALRAQVLDLADDIFDRYVWGESMDAIAASLPFKIPGWKLREVLMTDESTADLYANAMTIRSHNLIEASIDYGRQAAAIGDSAGLKVAIDANLKVAAKINPRTYGDLSKVELTGRDGAAMEVKADMTLTAEQAYERLIKGE